MNECINIIHNEKIEQKSFSLFLEFVPINLYTGAQQGSIWYAKFVCLCKKKQKNNVINSSVKKWVKM